MYFVVLQRCFCAALDLKLCALTRKDSSPVSLCKRVGFLDFGFDFQFSAALKWAFCHRLASTRGSRLLARLVRTMMPVFFRRNSGSARSRKTQGNESCRLCLSVSYRSAVPTSPRCAASSRRGGAVGAVGSHRRLPVARAFGSSPVNLVLRVPLEGFLRFLAVAQAGSYRALCHDLCLRSPCLSSRCSQAVETVLPRPVPVASQT